MHEFRLHVDHEILTLFKLHPSYADRVIDELLDAFLVLCIEDITDPLLVKVVPILLIR